MKTTTTSTLNLTPGQIFEAAEIKQWTETQWEQMLTEAPLVRVTTVKGYVHTGTISTEEEVDLGDDGLLLSCALDWDEDAERCRSWGEVVVQKPRIAAIEILPKAA